MVEQNKCFTRGMATNCKEMEEVKRKFINPSEDYYGNVGMMFFHPFNSEQLEYTQLGMYKNLFICSRFSLVVGSVFQRLISNITLKFYKLDNALLLKPQPHLCIISPTVDVWNSLYFLSAS